MPGRLTQLLHKLVEARSINRVDEGRWYPLRRLSATAKCSPFSSDTERRAVPDLLYPAAGVTCGNKCSAQADIWTYR